MLEKLLEENVSNQQGDGAVTGPLRVWIHRPASITTPQDESAAGPDAPILPRVLFYSRLLRAVPSEVTDGGRISGSLDSIPLETVGDDIVNIVMASSDTGASKNERASALATGIRSAKGITYVHHSGETVMELAKMREFFEAEAKEHGEEPAEFEALPLTAWTVRAGAAGLHPLLAGLFRSVGDQKKSLIFPKFVKSHRYR